MSLYVNKDKYEALPKHYQAVLEQASALASNVMIATNDAENPKALKRLIAEGAKLRAFPKPVMDACYKAAQETYAEFCAKDPAFKKIHDAYMAFRDEELPWFRIAEGSYDQYLASAAK